MKKILHIVAIFAASCLILAGCAAKSQDSDLSDKLSNVKDSAEDKAEDKAEDDSDKDADADELIEFSYRNNPVALTDPANGGELIQGNYYSVDLNNKTEKAYDKLDDALEKWNDDEENAIKDELASNQQEVIDLFSSGFEGECTVYTEFYPVRADSHAFSYALLHYVDFGGAHGYTTYAAYNFDPQTGDKISFSDVVRNTDDLPKVIVDELEKQNSDLVDYFKECPGDRDGLLEDIPQRLANDAEELVWALDYDGIRIYFEDYAMGAYAAGNRQVKISFADYPDIFTDKFDNYKGKDIPDIEEQAKKKDDAEKSFVEATSSMWDYNEGDDETLLPFFGLWVGSFSERQPALDLVEKLQKDGLDAYCIYSPEYENLSRDPYWCVTIGRSGSEPEAQAYIEDAKKAGYKDAYVKYTGERLSQRVYFYVYSSEGITITDSEVTLSEIPAEYLSGTAEEEGPMTLKIDSNTVFDDKCDMQYFPNYKKGESPLEWFNHTSAEDHMGVFEVSITGTHIDSFFGTYWWD